MNAAQKTQFNTTKVKFSPTKAAFERVLSLAKKHDGKLADSDNRTGVFHNTHDGVDLTADFRDTNNIIVKIDQRTIFDQPLSMTFTKSKDCLVLNKMLVHKKDVAYYVSTGTNRYLGAGKKGEEIWEYINSEQLPIRTMGS